MGIDKHKALLTVGSETMLGRVLRQLNEHECKTTIVVGHQGRDLMQAFMGKANFFINPWYDTCGSLFSLWWGALGMNAKQFLVGYCDAVVSDGIIEALIHANSESAIVVPSYDGRGVRLDLQDGFVQETTEASEPDPEGVTFSGFSSRMRSQLLSLPLCQDFDAAGASHGVQGCKVLTVDSWAVNVNTLEDLEYARELV